jgi:hypothetical protein
VRLWACGRRRTRLNRQNTCREPPAGCMRPFVVAISLPFMRRAPNLAGVAAMLVTSGVAIVLIDQRPGEEIVLTEAL